MGTTSILRPHQGNALMHVAKSYPYLLDVILETIQNAIDSGATRIAIAADQKKRSVDIVDNGVGATKSKFEEALQSVCQTMKMRDKLGQFGIGLISPLGKCERFTFTSCPKDSPKDGFREWTFVTADVENQADTVLIPLRAVSGYVYTSGQSETKRSDKGTVHYVPWRTKVHIENYTRDSKISRLNGIDELVSETLERFSVAMRQNNVRLNVSFVDVFGVKSVKTDIVAQPYTGKPLAPYVAQRRTAGRTTFNLYLARGTTKGAQGKVTFGQEGNAFRFGWRFFIMNAREYLDKDAAECLSSGILEGEILSQFAKLTESRKAFVKNDILADFCEAINEWYQKVGVHLMAEAKDENADRRYQELGLQSLQTIESMMKDGRFGVLAMAMESFKRGTVGDGHTPPKKGQVDGNQVMKSLSSHTGRAGDSNSGDSDGRTKEPPTESLSGHHPFTVAGPRGTRRKLVKNDSLGLQFAHVPMEGDDRLWDLDVENGILSFNIRHPHWVLCDTEDAAGKRKICQLQEYIAIQALTHFAVPESFQHVVGKTFDDMNEAFVFLLGNSPAYMRKNT